MARSPGTAHHPSAQEGTGALPMTLALTTPTLLKEAPCCGRLSRRIL